MEFDIVLPVSLFMFIVIAAFMYQKLENKIKSMFGEETKLGKREIVLMILAMGLVVTVVAFMPSRAIQIMYVSVLSYILFSFTYIAIGKWYIAIFPPIAFVLSYLLYWNILAFNLFAMTIACITTIYLGTLFSWKTITIYAILLTILDIFQVFGTGFMGQAAEKVLELSIPIMVLLPTYPIDGLIVLGLGDILLAGLLSLQMTLKHGPKAGIITAFTISVAMFLFEVVAFNTTYFTYFPATVVILFGWAASLGAARFINAKRS